MTDQPLCPRPGCGRLIHDQAYVDDRCEARLAADLRRVAAVAGEAMVTIAKLGRLGAGGRRTEPSPPLPVNLAAAEHHDAAVNTLGTWARHVAEERGAPLPTVRTAPCAHATCASRRLRVSQGPTCPGEPPEHPTAVLALWLVGQLRWLRHRPEADEAYGDLADACQVLERVVDRPPDRIVVGQCPCGAYLYAVRGAAQVTCGACGTPYAVDETRAMLRRSLDEALFTAAEIATLAGYLGLQARRDMVRHRINVWATRGIVVSHGDLGGAPAYRFGEVIARLMAG
jgi:hypothetical protein